MDDRLTELEIAFSLQEDTLDSLNKVITTLQQDILKLKKELGQIKGQVSKLEGDEPPTLLEQVPPHY